MVTKCANPSCHESFRYLRGGKLFLIEPPPFGPPPEAEFRDVFHPGEYFWLCKQCALTLTIASDKNGHVVLASRSHIHF